MYMPSKLGKGDIKPTLLPFPHISALLFLLLVCGVCLDLYRPEGRPEIEHTHAIFEQFMNLSGPSSTLFFPVAQREEVSHRRLRLRPPLVRAGGAEESGVEGSRKGQKRQFS